MSVFSADKIANSEVAEIISDLKQLAYEEVDVQFKGYTHGKRGFQLRVSDIQRMDDVLISAWMNVSDRYTSSIDFDTSSSSCVLEFKRIEETSRNYWWVYLSICVLSIYILWKRATIFQTPSFTSQTSSL
tara:strand:+ start:320 stop:709 length:390 start_codon:yes stop_codon:yes gene_type:complete